MDSSDRKHTPVDEVLLHDLVKHTAAILSKIFLFYVTIHYKNNTIVSSLKLLSNEGLETIFFHCRRVFFKNNHF